MAITKDAFVAALLESIDGVAAGGAALSPLVPAALPAGGRGRPDPGAALPGPGSRRRIGQARAAQRHRASTSTSKTAPKFPVCEGFCQAFQDKRVTDKIASHFGSKLSGTYLARRIRPGHRRLLARAAHRPRRQDVHHAALHVEGRRSTASLGTDIYD